MSFPFQPTTSIDWNHVSLTGVDGASHVESHYSQKTGEWSEPVVVLDPWIKVHGLSPALNYGQQCYEGMKACRHGTDKIVLFTPEKHADRMNHSCDIVSIPQIPRDFYLKCANLAVASNSQYVPPHDANALLYIRPLVFGSSPQLALTAPEEFIFAVFIQPGNAYHGVQAIPALIMEEFDRAAPLGTGSAKVGGNYAPVMKHSDKARREGFPLTLHLDSKTGTYVEEFSSSGFIGIKHGGADGKVTVVAPKSDAVIESITGDCVQVLAKSLGYDVQVRPIPYTELSQFDEVLAVGTATLLLPVASILHRSKGQRYVFQNNSSSDMGPVGKQLAGQLDAILRGHAPDSFGWCVPVYDPTPLPAPREIEISGNGDKMGDEVVFSRELFSNGEVINA